VDTLIFKGGSRIELLVGAGASASTRKAQQAASTSWGKRRRVGHPPRASSSPRKIPAKEKNRWQKGKKGGVEGGYNMEGGSVLQKITRQKKFVSREKD